MTSEHCFGYTKEQSLKKPLIRYESETRSLYYFFTLTPLAVELPAGTCSTSIYVWPNFFHSQTIFAYFSVAFVKYTQVYPGSRQSSTITV